ncbi:MAG: SdrD B-like domain-containing protein [Acidimicrobiales bacterium]
MELSLNDGAADALVAEVMLDPKQQWVQMPQECRADGTPASVIADSATGQPGGDKRLLVCNVGTGSEGTNRVLYPTARVVPVASDGQVTRNDDHVSAMVRAWAQNAEGPSAEATAGPTETTVTAGFKVNLTKSLPVEGVDAEGNPLYQPRYAVGPSNQPGTLMEYVVRATYEPGSMLADSDEVTYQVDYTLLDAYTDDNPNNTTGSGLSSGAIPYTWGPTGSACTLLGDHGAAASITCTPNQVSGDFVSAIGGEPPQDDPTITVQLDNVDVRDPDGDGNLFEFKLTLWHLHTSELDTDPSCLTGVCEIFESNRVGALEGGAQVGFNPYSTEDAGGNNLPNYGGAGEAFPTDSTASFPLRKTSPGGWSASVGWDGLVAWGIPQKATTIEAVAPGDVAFAQANVWDYRMIDGSSDQHCTKIDTSVTEFVGLTGAPAPSTTAYSFNRSTRNPSLVLWAGTTANATHHDPTTYLSFLYSTEPAAALTELQNDTCADDVNSDSVVNIQAADGTQSTPGAVVDWYADAQAVPGGNQAITKIRYQLDIDTDHLNALHPGVDHVAIAVNYDIKVKLGAMGYGPNNLIPLWAVARRSDAAGTWSSWSGVGTGSANPADPSFSYEGAYADRMRVVSSAHSIAKRTVPAGLKVVNAGQTVEFELQPQVLGQWNEATQSTAQIMDQLPGQTDFVFGSERFSVDGGSTWLTFAQYQVSSPDVTMTLAGSSVTPTGHGAAASRLEYHFADIQNSEQLPLIRYQVAVDSSVTSGTFTNSASIDSDMGTDTDGDGASNRRTVKYQVYMEAGTGFDVLKAVADQIVEVDTPIAFDLQYRNLGLEDYSGGSFIDVLPYRGDGDYSGGIQTDRTPASRYSGDYQVTAVSGGNSEVFWATDAEPGSVSVDPCAGSNLALGYVPTDGDLCYRTYSSSGATLPDGQTAGTGTTTWTQCTALSPLECGSLDPADITAIRFDTGVISGAGGAHTVTVTIDPVGNVGGTPAFNPTGRVTGASGGDIYTNNFGGRIPEISLNVISNDVSATVVAGSIGDRVWLDTDGDGVQDAGEAGAGGITVRLLAEDPASPGTFVFVAEAVTGTDGAYQFTNLGSGRYRVEVVPSGAISGLGQTFDADGAGDNASVVDLFGPDHPDTANGYTAANYADVDHNDSQDFGYDPTPGSIGDTVWYDTDGDGVQDGLEPGLAGVTVTVTYHGPDGVLGGDDDQVFTTATDSSGQYLIEDLPLGNYTVAVYPDSLPELIGPSGHPIDLASTYDADGGNDHTSTLTLTPVSPIRLDQDFGYQGSGSVGDTVWLDLDGDGAQDGSEPGLAGVTVIVTHLGPDGVPGGGDDHVFTTVTDSAGHYLVEGVPYGPVMVTVDGTGLPGGLTQTYDADGGQDSTSATTIDDTRRSDLAQDFGYRGPGSLGDTVWFDADGDGVMDPGEGPIDGVTVTVTYLGPDGVMGGGDDLTLTTTTDAEGRYRFDHLPLGDYRITVDGLPDGYAPTFDADGGGDNASAVSLTAETPVNLDQDFGYRASGEIGRTVWLDLDGDGVLDPSEPGLPGVGVTITYLGPDGVVGGGDDIVYSVVTDADGHFNVDGLPFGQYRVAVDTTTLPDRVGNSFDRDGTLDSVVTLWLDAGDPSDLAVDFGYVGAGTIGDTVWADGDGDGVQDQGEPGVGGVAVTVTYLGPDGVVGGGDDVTVSTRTDANGRYRVDGLPFGEYIVTIDRSTLPSGASLGHDADGASDGTSRVRLDDLDPIRLDQDFGLTIGHHATMGTVAGVSPAPVGALAFTGSSLVMLLAGGLGLAGSGGLMLRRPRRR